MCCSRQQQQGLQAWQGYHGAPRCCRKLQLCVLRLGNRLNFSVFMNLVMFFTTKKHYFCIINGVCWSMVINGQSFVFVMTRRCFVLKLRINLGIRFLGCKKYYYCRLVSSCESPSTWNSFKVHFEISQTSCFVKNHLSRWTWGWSWWSPKRSSWRFLPNIMMKK